MNHTQLLNYLIQKHSLKSYLEIGVRDTASNFDKILCRDKTGIDPVEINDKRVYHGTSDVFFDTPCLGKWDLIFIDGLHHADQVHRDFENSLEHLSDNGFIVIHDCLPTDEKTTCVPRGTQKMWHGDVYKFCMTISNYTGIDYKTLDMDCGCMVVWKGEGVPNYSISHVTWESYVKHGKKLMNIIDPEAFII